MAKISPKEEVRKPRTRGVGDRSEFPTSAKENFFRRSTRPRQKEERKKTLEGKIRAGSRPSKKIDHILSISRTLRGGGKEKTNYAKNGAADVASEINLLLTGLQRDYKKKTKLRRREEREKPPVYRNRPGRGALMQRQSAILSPAKF